MSCQTIALTLLLPLCALALLSSCAAEVGEPAAVAAPSMAPDDTFATTERELTDLFRAVDAGDRGGVEGIAARLRGLAEFSAEHPMAVWPATAARLAEVYAQGLRGEKLADAAWVAPHVDLLFVCDAYGRHRIGDETARMLEASDRELQPLDRANLHSIGGKFATFVGDVERATMHCVGLEDVATEPGVDPHRPQIIASAGEARYRLGHMDRAWELIHLATKESEGHDRPNVPLWRTRGFLEERSGAFDAAAESHGLCVADAVNSEDVTSESAYRMNRGRALRKAGRLEEAKREFLTAVERARSVGSLPNEAAARDGLSRVALALNDLTEARRQIDACLRIEREERLDDFLSDSLQASARIGIAEGDLAAAAAALAEAESCLEPGGLGPHALAQYRSRFAEWMEIAQSLTHAEWAAAATADRAGVVATGLSRQSAWRGRSLRSAATDQDSDSLLRAIQSGLGATTVLARYASTGDDLCAYVVTASTVELIALGSCDEIYARADAYVNEACLSRRASSASAVARLGRDAAESLIDPIRASVPDTIERAVIVATDELASLPFAALIVASPNAPQRLTEVRFLIEDWEIASAPSVSFLADSRARSARETADRGLYLGDAIVPLERAASETAGAPPTWTQSLASLPQTRNEVVEAAFRRVPENEREGEVARRDDLLAPESERSDQWSTDWFDVLLGKHASLAALEGDLTRYDEIHFACHGGADPLDPSKRALVLSANAGDDGMLDLDRIRSLKLDTNVVFLSACHTASGPTLRGDGAQSIAAAVLEAGSRAVVSTLWDVQDSTTCALAVHSRALRAQGLSTCASLRMAQQWLWTDAAQQQIASSNWRGLGSLKKTETKPDPRHPNAWAVYVFVGRP